MTNIDKNNTNEPADDNRAQPKKLGAKLPRKYAILLVLIVILIGLIVAYGSIRNRDQSEEQPHSLDETFQKNDVLLSNKNYDEALSEWNKFMAHQTNPEDQAQGHLGIAVVYINKQDYAAALESYKRAEQLSSHPNQSIYNGIINIARINNDKALEIEYSRKAIEALDKNHPLYEADKSGYEKRIEELNAKSD